VIDLGLVNGEVWAAEHVDALEAAINANEAEMTTVTNLTTVGITQGVALGGLIAFGKAVTPGAWAHGIVRLSPAIAGTSAQEIRITGLPATSIGIVGPIGHGWLFDASTGFIHTFHLEWHSTYARLFSNSNGYLGAVQFTDALATNDVIQFAFSYPSP
jgi:hypothetical protein